MSKWLTNVGNFLEKLDEGAGQVVAERVVGGHGAGEEDPLHDVPEDVQLQSILAARGLGAEEEEEEEPRSITQQQEAAGAETTETGNDGNDLATAATAPAEEEHAPSPSSDEFVDVAAESLESKSPQEIDAAESQNMDEPTATVLEQPPPSHVGPADGMETSAEEPENTRQFSTPARNPPPSESHATAGPLSPNSHALLRESQKESRTLRRHVVALNKQLEHAETELQAQRVELERAAERMEKDRNRHKQDRETEKQRHAEEVKAMKAQNEKTLKELKQRSDQQIEEIRKQLRNVEERRMQEGGDWNKELIDAVQREQEMAGQLALIQDEKGTLLSQISILQDQQMALGNRIESLSQTADNAMERERESETRLDEALNLHARQIAQRQARESELERTVSELGSALVAERSKKDRGSSSRSAVMNETSDASSMSGNQSTVARLQTLEHDMEGVVAQLNYEKQRCETLQNELRDVSKERTEEATANHSRQIKNDRQIAELSHTNARLEAELRLAKTEGRSSVVSLAEQEDVKHIRELSEEVLAQREKIANNHSEISALKSRLQVAQERVRTAEAALESEPAWRDVERAPTSGEAGGSMRRRGRRGGGKTADGESMRAALHLDSVRSKSSEQIGQALDGVDAFLVASGKFLRYNALARLLFISYLLTLHIWTFVLIILHAHGFETVHGDFGAGVDISHGPNALMQGAALAQQQQAVAAVAVNNVPAPDAAAAAAVGDAAGH